MIGYLKTALGAAAIVCSTQAHALIPVEISSIFTATGYERVYNCPTGLSGCVPTETAITGNIRFRTFISDAIGVTAFSVDAVSDQGPLGIYTATVYNLGKAQAGMGLYGVMTSTFSRSTLDLSCTANCTGTETFLSSDYGQARVIAGTLVPEPTTWALMLAGFGMVGYALRRRVRVAYA